MAVCWEEVTVEQAMQMANFGGSSQGGPGGSGNGGGPGGDMIMVAAMAMIRQE